MTLLGVLSDLHLGYQKVTWKKLGDDLYFLTGFGFNPGGDWYWVGRSNAYIYIQVSLKAFEHCMKMLFDIYFFFPDSWN